MNIAIAALEVLVGAFALFTIARIAHGALLPRAGWAWVLLVALLGLGNMLFHRWLGNSVNPPFFTAVFFGVTLMGLAPDDTVADGAAVSSGSEWHRRALFGLIVGTVLGWVSYIEVSSAYA